MEPLYPHTCGRNRFTVLIYGRQYLPFRINRYPYSIKIIHASAVRTMKKGAGCRLSPKH